MSELDHQAESVPQSTFASFDDGNSDIWSPADVTATTSTRSDSSSSFYALEVLLIEGRDLVIRDSCGTSDPYVKFKVGSKLIYRSRTVFRNLNPRWDERFHIPIVGDPESTVIRVKVFDYDRGMHDDRMGCAMLRPGDFKLDQPTDVKLMLSDDRRRPLQSRRESYFGYLQLQCTLIKEDKLQYIKRMTTRSSIAASTVIASGLPSGASGLMDSVRRAASAATGTSSSAAAASGTGSATAGAGSGGKQQLWNAVVTIVLIDGHSLVARDDDGFSDPYVKFRLGSERYKSKWKPKTLSPSWYEQFDLYMYDDSSTSLEISVFDHDSGARDDFMGRATIDLIAYAREKTHQIDVSLEDSAGHIRLLLTISGLKPVTSPSNVDGNEQRLLTCRERENIVRKYGLFQSFKEMKDIGWLQVKVIRAQDLKSADIGGKSDPYCVLELVNDRLQTHTEYKTLSPEWGKIFTFNVKDIHSILEVTVYDEDRDKKVEFLGKVAIPLLRVQCGKPSCYQLKDRKLRTSVPGLVELQFDLIFSHVKAAVRTFNPREQKHMKPEPKFKIMTMKSNIERVHKILEAIFQVGRFIQSCFSWESASRSLIAFLVFLVIVWNFELYMLPLTLVILFLKNLILNYLGSGSVSNREEDSLNLRDDDDEDETKDQSKNTSIREKLQSIQDVLLTVQEFMDMAASLGERVKNVFRWSVPWLSVLAIIVLTIATIILYNIPLRYLILAWGINKFTKKLRSPNAIDNNELLDFLSRVPSDKELVEHRELRLETPAAPTKKK